MDFRGQFQAVSLDLWFTTVYYRTELENRWREDRLRTLGDLLRSRTGDRLETASIEAAVETVHNQLKLEGKNTGLVDPQAILMEYARSLGAELTTSPEEAGRIFSGAGLVEHPPTVNPEVPGVIRSLEARNIPVIAITNTARRGESWQEFFRTRTEVRFQHVIASCEVGRAKPDAEIFMEASQRLGIPPSKILHVGDRWELDVEGALGVGCGAVLYRGLWSRYSPTMYPTTDPALLRNPNVLTIDRLDELLNGA